MRITTRSLSVAAVALALLLVGCASNDQVATEATEESSPSAESASPSSSEPSLSPVNEADLPDWFPSGIPMPAGDYRRGVTDDSGVTLTFGISGEQVILDLVEELAAAGFGQTALDEHGEGWKTWFTESEEHRVNIAARDLGTSEAWIDYRIEPK